MTQLIKYEIIKRYKSLSIALIIFVLIVTFQLFSLFDGDIIKVAITSGSYVILGVGLFIYLFVNNIRIFSGDLLNKSGYMSFMTPYNSYQIMGSKVLAALLENIFFLIIYTGFSVIFLTLLKGISSDYVDLSNVTIEYDLNDIFFIFLLGFNIVLGWFNLMLTISLAITLYKSVLAHIKYGGLISFGFFLLINYVLNKVYSFFIYNDYVEWFFFDGVQINTLNVELLINAVVYMIVGAILFIYTGYLIDKKADF